MGKSRTTRMGTRLQSGINHKIRGLGTPNPNGLLLKGVVLATYVTDDLLHPKIKDKNNRPLAVYCDVAVYPSISRQRWFFLKQVLVSQKRGGIQDDDLWKPKAAKSNVVTQIFSSTIGANPGQLDGDHVLVGFMNNSFDEPIILRGIPHPSRDVGNELYPAGKRLKLSLIDGTDSPDFDKYQGVFRGVDGSGNHVVDSTFGHSGILLPNGAEPPSDVLGISGNQTRNLPQNSVHEVVFYNMASPVTPVEVARFECNKDAFEVLLTLFPTLKVEGSALTAKLTLGSGTVSATIAEHLSTLWGLLITWLSAHTHPTGTGPSGPPNPNPAPPVTPPPWNSAIQSGKVTFPDG